MNKKDVLIKKAEKLLAQARQIEINNYKKVGKLIVELYEKNQIMDEGLVAKIALLVGDKNVKSKSATNKNATTFAPENINMAVSNE